jgi:hypothetical protein
MKNIYLRNLLIGSAFIFVLSSAIMNTSGPGPSYTNAPNESNCTSCHGGSIVTSGNSNLNNIRLNSNFTGNGYIPDSIYVMELTFKQTGRVKFGFEVTCLDKNNSPAGTLTSTTSRTSKVTGTVNSQTREYIQHTTAGTANVGTDSTRWVFTWKAPSNNVGPVKFHMVVMATNNNGSNDAGDIVYGKSFQINPSTLLPVAKPKSNDTITCTNYNVQLQGGGTNSPTSYSWKMTGGTPSASTAQNPTVTYTTSGTKQVILTVRNNKGISFPDTMDILVNASPIATILNGSSASICQGDSLLLSANTGANLSYLWLNNNKTVRNIYAKDTVSYTVKVTNTSNQCAKISPQFKLFWYVKPTVTLTKNSNDSICGPYNETITASGNLIDSVLWYVNGVLSRRAKTLTTVFTGSSPINITAIAKSVNGCRSSLSNSLRLVSIPKLYPSNFQISKTSSAIDLSWKKSFGVLGCRYSLNGGSFSNTTSDTTLKLSGLQPNTSYNITIRSIQNSPCKFSDSNFVIKTNFCSNILFNVNLDSRVCKGSSLTAKVTKLYAAKYSIAFNKQGFGKDTIYTFTPSKSDSLTITILDSLSPTCPAIVEKYAYIVDTLFDKSNSTATQASSCINQYNMNIVSGYSAYEYYKNGVLQNASANNSYLFTGLNSGDKLSAIGKINSCSKSYGQVTFIVNPTPISTFSFTRSYKNYNFSADAQSNASYLWKVGQTVIGNTASFTKDMGAYINSSIAVRLICSTANNCIDSSVQNITVPDFTSILNTGKSAFNVYPNPFNDNLNIEGGSNGFTLRLLDHLGKIILVQSTEENSLIISSSEFSNGVYYIVIQDNDGTMNKFTIVKAQ